MSAARMWCAVALTALTALGIHGRAIRPRTDSPATPIQSFAREVAGWRGTDVPLSDRQYALLESRDVLFREYRRDDGPEVLACVAVAGGNRKVAHPPEICYRGQGWKILSNGTGQVRVGNEQRPVQVLRIEKGGREVLVFSWYRVGRRGTPSYLKQQWWGVRADLVGSMDASALLRFSAPARDSDWNVAEQTLRAFLEQVVPGIERTLDRRMEQP